MAARRGRAVGVALLLTLALACVAFFVWVRSTTPQAGRVRDEALMVGRDAGQFSRRRRGLLPRHGRHGVALTPEEVKGRNTWLVWTAGNDRSVGRTGVTSLRRARLPEDVSSVASGSLERGHRRQPLGVFRAGQRAVLRQTDGGPDPKRFGLWLDERRAGLPARPVRERAQVSRRHDRRARTRTVPLGSYYGVRHGHRRACGCSRTPISTSARRKAWDAERYYTDPSYYNSNTTLIRPYRVGMSCGFCHVGPNPDNPPADPDNPEWENLSSNVGAQYFWIDRIFDWDADPSNFVVPAVPRLAAGHARYLARLQRQHQQPADDERHLLLRAAPARRQALGQGDAGRRRAEQQAVQRLRQGRARSRSSSRRPTSSGRRGC